jgi:PKD repeat protein
MRTTPWRAVILALLLAAAGCDDDGRARNRLPQASFAIDVVTDLSIQVDASASTDADGSIVAYRWDFGDGSPVDVHQAPVHGHQYLAAGTYMITLVVQDDRGARTEHTRDITLVANQQGTARFTATPGHGVAPVTVHFDASASTDPDGIVAYHWLFDDGSPGVTTATPQVDHHYAAPGNYGVTLIIEGGNGVADHEILQFVSIAPPPPPGARLWSEAAAWPGGVKPVAGQAVTIPMGEHVVLDEDTPALGGLTLLGTLEFARRDLALTADWIMLHGALQVGSEEFPFFDQAVITLAADDPAEDVMGMGTRGLMVMGGALDLHGVPPPIAWGRLSQHAAAGATELTVEFAGWPTSGWKAGDEIVIAPTDFHGVVQTERIRALDVAEPAGAGQAARVTLEAPLAAPRWGLLQYATTAGMSLSEAGRVTPPAMPTPLVLDERAEVGNLTRNVVIQAPDDALWQDDGFGAHVMVMDLASSVRIDGVEFRRGGQRGILGRYPLHWHRLSYAASGAEIGDAAGHYVRSSTFNQSSNRCVTIHATNGVTVQDNICYDVLGHAMFTEDAVERRNVFLSNLVLRVRRPEAADALKIHDRQGGFGGGASCFWISNPDNRLTGNAAADCAAFGFWLAFPQAPVGPSANVPIRPDRTLFGAFEFNTAHSNGAEGVMLDFVEIDDAGNTQPNRYISTTDGVDPVFPFPNKRRFALRHVTSYKNGRGGIWDRVDWPDITDSVLADNNGRFIAGAGGDGLVTRSLIVGTSLNDTPRLPGVTEAPTAFATYHSTFDLRQNVIVGFPLVPGERSGVFSTDDYYIRAVDKGHARNPDNLWIGSHPGYRVQLPPTRSFALAGALWDPWGIWGPAGNWSVFDTPFLTHGAACQPVAPAADSGALSCSGGPFYGVMSFVLDQANSRFSPTFALDVTRYDAALNPLAPGWRVEEGIPAVGLTNMRHFAAAQGGTYLLDFPGSPVPGDVGFTVENMLDTGSTVVVGVRFDGADPAAVYATTQFNYFDPAHETAPDSGGKHTYAPVASLAEVIASPGETFWQDPANDVVWVKLRGGLQQPWNDADYHEFTDERLYRSFHLRIH